MGAFDLAVEILFGLLFGVFLMSFIEYVLHRWPMHSRPFLRRFPWLYDTFERHAVLHHGRYFKDRFVGHPDPAARHLNIGIEPGFNVLGLAPLWVPLLLLSVPAGLAMAAVFGLHAAVWSSAHAEMHDPRGRLIGTTAYFRYLRPYHHTHHKHPGCNFATVFPPFWDLVFGTHRGTTGD
jgi:hypothetical protein